MRRLVFQAVRGLARVARALLMLVLAVGGTLVFFLVLPLLETTTRPAQSDLEIREVGGADLPPPPPPPVEEEKKEAEPDQPPPPEMANEAPPLDLSQLELALNPGTGNGMGDFAVRLPTAESGGLGGAAEDLFSASDLDQQPRPIFQPAPDYPADLRRKRIEGTVLVLFIVDRNGRVLNPIVQKSAHAALEGPALQAVRRWRFEPGKREGQPVQFKMRVPISFTGR